MADLNSKFVDFSLLLYLQFIRNLKAANSFKIPSFDKFITFVGTFWDKHVILWDLLYILKVQSLKIHKFEDQ